MKFGFFFIDVGPTRWATRKLERKVLRHEQKKKQKTKRKQTPRVNRNRAARVDDGPRVFGNGSSKVRTRPESIKLALLGGTIRPRKGWWRGWGEGVGRREILQFILRGKKKQINKRKKFVGSTNFFPRFDRSLRAKGSAAEKRDLVRRQGWP